MQNDVIGIHVKKFESGSYGSLSFSQSGNDWGISCGSYQLTLRWGNCIKFLKKYFPSESKALYFNDELKDFSSKSYPGPKYCSDPDAVRSIWIKAYNKVGADLFFKYEWEYIKENYYDKLKSKISHIIDLDNSDRAFQECFWSWSIHEGVTGANNSFIDMLNDNHIDYLDYVDKEELFDLIYDTRYNKYKFQRYSKSFLSERETLRKFLTPGTFSGITREEALKIKEEEYAIRDKKRKEELEKIESTIEQIYGTIKIVYTGEDGVNVRDFPNFKDSNVIQIFNYGESHEIIGITSDEKFFKLKDGGFITTADEYVMFIPEIMNEPKVIYKVRVLADKLPITKQPNNDEVVGFVNKDQVFSIIDEENSYGKLKSGSGWIYIDNNVKKYI